MKKRNQSKYGYHKNGSKGIVFKEVDAQNNNFISLTDAIIVTFIMNFIFSKHLNKSTEYILLSGLLGTDKNR
jgi:hypothetical protein